METPKVGGLFHGKPTRLPAGLPLCAARTFLLGMMTAVLMGMASSGHATDTPNERAQETMPLPAPGETVVAEQGTHRQEVIELASGDLVYLLVRQQGLDVRLRLAGPNGYEMEVDSPSGNSGLEELIAIAREPGSYRLEILAATGAGEYVVSSFEHRPANPADIRWAEAAEAFLRGRSLLKAKNPAAALEAFRAALAVWQELRLGYRLAATHEQIGNALAQLQGVETALGEFAQAVDYFRLLGERRQLAANLQKLATYELQLGRFAEAVPHLEETLVLFRAIGFPHGEGLCLARLGYAHLGLGRPREALSYLEDALRIAEGLTPPTLQAAFLVDLGKALLTLNRSQEAFERYARAAEIYQAHNTDEGLEIALIGMANAGIQMEDPELAEEAAERVAKLTAKGGSARIRAAVLVVRSNVLRLRREWQEARVVLEQALALVAASSEPLLEADILLNLGHLESLLGSPARGLELQDQSFALFEKAGMKTGMASSQARAAEALLELGRFEEAWTRLQSSLAEVERFRAATARRDQRLAFFGSFRQDYFELARRALLGQHAQKPEAGFDRLALQVDDRRRSRELIESVRSAPVGSEKNSQEAKREQDLQGRLQTMAINPTGALAPETSRILTELHELRARPQTEELQAEMPKLEVDLLQRNLLDEDTLLLVYALGKKEAVLWGVGRETLRTVILEDVAGLVPLARDFIELLARWPDRQEQRRDEIGRELSQRLLKPVADLLGKKRLLIVADGDLQILPFSALPHPGSQDPRSYLALSHEIVLLPSVSLLNELSRRSTSMAEKPRIAVFADPLFDPKDPRLEIAKTDAGTNQVTVSRKLEILTRDLRFSFPPARLLFSGVEGTNILAFSPGEENLLLTGSAANLDSFKKIDWSQFQILHFATHAYLHVSPELSSLALSLVNEKGERRDGLLLAAEVSAMKLPLDLVVLSACQTGSGTIQPGEGVLGLTWAFLDAGAKRVVSSLWKVGDRSTSQLMTWFYEEMLKNKKAPAAALREAQTRMARLEGSTPADWAGFVIQGDWR